MSERYTRPRYELPFPLSEYKDRLRRVREAMQKAGVDVQIVNNYRDLYWLSGTRCNRDLRAHAIIWEGDPIMIIRHLEASAHTHSIWTKNFVEFDDEGPINPYDPMKKAAETLIEHGLDKKRIGLNFRVTSLQNYERLRKLLPDAEFRDFRVERTRIIKSKLEQECQFRAAKVNQDVLINTISDIEVGWSEQDIESSINRYQRKFLGNDYEGSRELLCMVGPSALHMHQTRYANEKESMKIKKGDIVYIEPGTFIKRYVGSMIRMVSFGEPPAHVRRSAEASIEALNRAIEATAPGKTSHEVDKAARDYFVKMGLDCQGRIGYSNGIDWSQGDVMSIEPNNQLILVPGHIFHYISINYLPGWGYIGASEQVLVTEDGHEVLSERDKICPRQLFIK